MILQIQTIDLEHSFLLSVRGIIMSTQTKLFGYFQSNVKNQRKRQSTISSYFALGTAKDDDVVYLGST